MILIDGDDYVGHAVNLAARLCAAAEPRQVLAIADDIVHLYTDIVSVPAGRREIPVSRTPSTSSRSDADVDPDRSTWTDFERAAGAVLDALQPGDLVTYGEVAAEAGYPGAARAVGSLLRRAPSGTFAWWRVIAASGPPGEPRGGADVAAAEGRGRGA